MGHLAGSKSSLIPLIDRLNQYPIGLVDNAHLREILSILFSPEEARVGAAFPLHEATLEELVERTGTPAEALAPVLESMADKGLVMDMDYAGHTYYLLVPGLIGFMEFTFMRRRADTELPLERLAQLMSEYLHEQGRGGQPAEFFGSPTQLTRALVYDEHVPVNSRITSYEDARAILEQADYLAVTLCYCRHKKEHLGEHCRKGAPVEDICMVLGEGARFLVRRGFARECDLPTMLEKLELARSLGLTHVTDNVREQPSFLCNCCRCCCELMAGVQMGFSDGIAKTPFLAEIDPERCDYCGACFPVCNVKCIGLAEGLRGVARAQRHAAIDPAVCLGCAACLDACPQGAITLVARPNPATPPRDKGRMFARILWEKGRLWPFVRDRVGQGVRRLLDPGRRSG
ncbi:4Fe-4S binding protein [Marichromatium bheemlicum]|uniref:4Fe-4S binding protein n=1 Tax=Marichromatium bheemlicum TaxID=365339 RepID=A0ABX1IDH4_9GAMM|nr:4Fe-4S binding protein [Marichromatium bheemlicum]NKN34390.1 4Fe-4S binding protein [Marichromatium bheemlicum]